MITSINIVRATYHDANGTLGDITSHFEIEFTIGDYRTTHIVSYQAMHNMTYRELEELLHDKTMREIETKEQIEELRSFLKEFD